MPERNAPQGPNGTATNSLDARPTPQHLPTRDQLKARLAETTLAFRGYNVTNLGRSSELLEHPRYSPIVTEFLQRASQTCTEVTGKRTDLVTRVKERRETSLATYHEAIGLIVAMELAQLELLRVHFQIDLSLIPMVYGFSLGEITALVAGAVLKMEDALRIPLSLAADSVALADDVTLAVLFSRTENLSLEKVSRICQEINAEGAGVMGVSAYLAPNSMLLVGQGSTVDRFAKRRDKISTDRVFVRKNDHRWPPLHTPIVWQHHISDRARYLMHTMPCSFVAPRPQILSLVTGDFSYTETNTRHLIGQWVDHPQRLWDAVDKTLSLNLKQVIHVGPDPNIIPATFERLKSNVETQAASRFGVRALRGMVIRPWLSSMLPKRATLLRATQINQFNLEDWLLAQGNS